MKFNVQIIGPLYLIICCIFNSQIIFFYETKKLELLKFIMNFVLFILFSLKWYKLLFIDLIKEWEKGVCVGGK